MRFQKYPQGKMEMVIVQMVLMNANDEQNYFYRDYQIYPLSTTFTFGNIPLELFVQNCYMINFARNINNANDHVMGQNRVQPNESSQRNYKKTSRKVMQSYNNSSSPQAYSCGFLLSKVMF